MLEESHKRLDRGKPDIAAADLVAANRLQVLQESEDERRIDLLQLQGGRRDSELSTGKREQQLESIRVGISRMFADSLLNRGGAPGGMPLDVVLMPSLLTSPNKDLPSPGNAVEQFRRVVQVPEGDSSVKCCKAVWLRF